MQKRHKKMCLVLCKYFPLQNLKISSSTFLVLFASDFTAKAVDKKTPTLNFAPLKNFTYSQHQCDHISMDFINFLVDRITEYYYIHRGTLEPCAWWGSQQRPGAWDREMNITNFCIK